MPLVSIIMNVRNGARYLREAMDSVMAQTFTGWELIVWDDCSTDDSAAIVCKYSDPRVHYFLSPEDTPLGEARNRAIQQATGDWLAFLDQDDVWLPQKLEKQMALAADGVGIIYGRAILFSDRRGNIRDYDYFHEFQPLPEGNIFAALFREACFIAMSSVVLRRSAVVELGGIPEEIQVVPDYYLYVAVAQRYKARAVQEIVCRYRIHSESMSSSHEHRRRLHYEPLLMLQWWAPFVDRSILRYRRMTYSTALALEEMKHVESFSAGLGRLFTDGSLFWLASRPFVRGWRILRRHVWRPYWKRQQERS